MSPYGYISSNEKIGPFGSTIEKDPTIDNLEKKLLETFHSILPKEPDVPKTSPTGVVEFSFENVLREMLANKNTK